MNYLRTSVILLVVIVNMLNISTIYALSPVSQLKNEKESDSYSKNINLGEHINELLAAWHTIEGSYLLDLDDEIFIDSSKISSFSSILRELAKNSYAEPVGSKFKISLSKFGEAAVFTINNQSSIDFHALRRKALFYANEKRLVERSGTIEVFNVPVDNLEEVDYRILAENDVMKLNDNDLLFIMGLGRGKEVSEKGGHGVGLEIVKRNIDILKGKLTVVSGRSGTEITVTIPLVCLLEPLISSSASGIIERSI